MSHLTEQDRDAVRAALMARRTVVLDEIVAAERETGETQFAELLGRRNGDSSDEALAVTIGDLAAARLDLELGEFNRLEAARLRLDATDFGQCGECGEEIPAARLVVNPAAGRCIACQALFERTHVTHGRSF
jgi:DnaK suppressor protein